MTLSRLRAKEVLNNLGIDACEDLFQLEDICWTLGAIVRYVNMEGFEASLTTSNGKGVISINNLESFESRKRFSIGHELGHFLLHQGENKNYSCTKKNMEDWFVKKDQLNIEIEANEFSIEFLMPDFLVKSIVQGRKPSLKIIEELTASLKMSYYASLKRFVELSDEPVAMIVYDKSMIKYHFPSSSFRSLGFWIDPGPLSSETIAFEASKGKDYGAMLPVFASSWFNTKPWLKEEEIKESSKYFEKFDMGFSLIWIDNRKFYN